MSTAIRVEGLGKRYKLGTGGILQYRMLREELARGLGNLTGRNKARQNETLWALRDVSFDVSPGERVGIIGRNGAGKTTLLKLLSRITWPTEGRAEVVGKVASLLEVGTGFHPELTGRENIFMSGAILGMRHKEIRAKIDEIVEFAGVQRFLDTPVKRYSSGMHLRLGFAVAAHLEPDILLVDEVLAVGDADFQKKCLGRMGEISRGGRTVLFISHSMPAVLRLCERVILLDGGHLVKDGPAEEVTRAYLESGLGSSAERSWAEPEAAPGDAVVRLKSVRVLTDEGRVSEEVDIRRPVDVEVEYWHLAAASGRHPSVRLCFTNEDNVILFVSNDFTLEPWRRAPRRPGVVRATCRIPGNFLAEGTVFVKVGVWDYSPDVIHLDEPDVVSFQVVDRSMGDAVRGEYVKDWPGVIRPMLDWSIEAPSFGPVRRP